MALIKKINILVVDDEEVIRELFTKTLGIKGYKVTAVGDGPSAIEAVKKDPYDLIFLDVVMPQMDGIEVFKEIKKITRVPIVTMMTGFNVGGKLKEAEQLGAYNSLHKPFDIPEIIKIIERVQREKIP